MVITFDYLIFDFGVEIQKSNNQMAQGRAASL